MKNLTCFLLSFLMLNVAAAETQKTVQYNDYISDILCADPQGALEYGTQNATTFAASECEKVKLKLVSVRSITSQVKAVNCRGWSGGFQLAFRLDIICN